MNPSNEEELAQALADNERYEAVGYCFTDRGLTLICASEDEAKRAYEDAISKGHKCELHEDRLLMLDL